MRKHKELFDKARQRPGMYFREDDYDTAAAFVLGFDLACEGGVLAGFREWLVVRLGSGSNLAWSALVLDAAFPGVEDPQAELAEGLEKQRRAIDKMWDLLSEFEVARIGPDGLGKIFVAYDKWEESQRRR